MGRFGRSAPGPQEAFVWEAEDEADEAAPAPAEPAIAADAVEPEAAREGAWRSAPQHHKVLIGSCVLVLLAGTAYGISALSSPQDTAAALGAPPRAGSTSGPAADTGASPAPASTDASPAANGSATASRQASTAPAEAVTMTRTAHATKAASAINAAGRKTGSPASVASGTTMTTVPQPAPVGAWPLNQTSGTSVGDTEGAKSGTATSVTWSGGAGVFNGSNSAIVTDGPVLSTGPGQSFTVSAWVDMTAEPTAPQYDETAVSQGAVENSAFYLQFTEPADRWAFSRMAGDGDGGSAYRALSTSAPSLNTWVHLVGVYDAADETQYLYVNGVLQGSVKDPTPFASGANFVIGRALYHGSHTDWFTGRIKEVEAFDMALTSSEVEAL